MSKVFFITFNSISGLTAFKYQISRAFLAGEYPLWNPYTICGSPFHTGIGILDPFLMPQFFLKGSMAVMASSYLALISAGIFMFLYLRKSWRLSFLASLVGSALYLANPFFSAASNEPPFMNPPVYLPLIMLFSDLGIRRRSYFYSSLAGIALAMTFLSGNIESYCYIAVVFFMLEAARIYFDTSKKDIQVVLVTLKFLITSFFISILFMAIDLLPTVEAVLNSSRRDSFVLLQTGLFTMLSALFAFLAINIYRSITSPDKRPGNVVKAFIIIVSILLFTVNLSKKPSFWFLGGMLMQEAISHFKDPAYLFTVPTLIIFLSLLWLNKKDIINFYIFFAIFLALPSYTLFPDLFKYILRMNTIQFPRVMFIFFFITSLSIAYFIDVLNNGKPGRRVIRLILTILLISEALIGWKIYTYQSEDIKILDDKRPEITFMSEKIDKDYRIGIWHGDGGYEKDAKSRGFDLSWNTSLFWGIKNVEKSAMNFTRPRFDRLWRTEDKNTSVTPTVLAGITTPIYDLMGMRYLLSKELLDVPSYSLALKGPDYHIYENRNAMPRLYSVNSIISAAGDEALDHIKRRDFDIKKTAYVEFADEKDILNIKKRLSGYAANINYKTLKDGYNITRFKVDTSEDTFIVMTDAFDKNWRAYIDGIRKNIYLCNYYFKGFALDKGRHIVELRYEPPAFFFGLALTLATSAFVTLLYFTERKKREA